VSSGLARIQYLSVERDIRPNVEDMAPHFLQATSLQHLHTVVPTLHVMRVVMIARMPMRQSVKTMVVMQSISQILRDRSLKQNR
jgi:hypothetical protein